MALQGEPAQTAVLYDEGLMPLVLSMLGDAKERHCAAPLVCRRWRDLVHSPQLLRSLDISLTSTQALPAFCAWLAGRAAAHVECLHLDLQAEASFADTHLLLGSLQACARLCELHLSVFGQLTVSPELLGPLCGSLVRLRLQGESRGHESAGTAVYAFELEQLSRLEQLWLAGSAVELHRSQLPPSLTQLLLEGFRDLTAPNRHALPRQLEVLAQLRSLHLMGVYANTPDCYRPLLRLPALETLALTRCACLPACLPQLSTLRALCLEEAPLNPDDHGPELARCVPGLGEALTCLALRRMDFAEGGLPREVAALARLRRLLWCPTPQPQFALGYQWGRWGAPAALPAGPWLASLQQAVLSSAVAAASLRVLAAAPQLRELVTVGAPFYEREQCREQDVALWAAARPPPALRRVTLNIDTTTLLDYHRLDLLQQLQHCAARARSAVDIQVVEAPQAAAAQEPLLSVAEADAL